MPGVLRCTKGST